MIKKGDKVLTWKEIENHGRLYLLDWEGEILKIEGDKVQVKRSSTGDIEWFPLNHTVLDSRWNNE